MKLNVLSLFDGMACGLKALKQSGIQVKNYYASEVDKYAIQIAMKNHPEIIQLGDVNNWKKWNLPKIDLIIGGSPCQGFSFAGKQFNFKDVRSKLFFIYVDVLKVLKPKYFLLENVRMKKEYRNVITEYLGVEPIEINSSLVTAQNRNRLYWTNIKGVKQPKDKGILLKDVVLKNTVNSVKGLLFTESYVLNPKFYEYVQQRREQIVFRSKSQTLLATLYKENVKSMLKRNKIGLIILDGKFWRKFLPIECERLQTLPDDYTKGVSNTQRYKMIGNGWTISVIEHIFNHLPERYKV